MDYRELIFRMPQTGENYVAKVDPGDYPRVSDLPNRVSRAFGVPRPQVKVGGKWVSLHCVILGCLPNGAFFVNGDLWDVRKSNCKPRNIVEEGSDCYTITCANNGEKVVLCREGYGRLAARGCHVGVRGGYATIRLLGPRGRRVSLHRFLMQPGKGEIVDHKDNNPLNNRLSNLRLCSHVDNMHARKGRSASCKFQFTGVSLNVKNRKSKTFNWRACEAPVSLGRNETEADAVRKYNAHILGTRGRFAALNPLGMVTKTERDVVQFPAGALYRDSEGNYRHKGFEGLADVSGIPVSLDHAILEAERFADNLEMFANEVERLAA